MKNNSLEKTESSEIAVNPKVGDIYIRKSNEHAIRLFKPQGKENFQYEWMSDVLNKVWELDTNNDGTPDRVSAYDLKEYYHKVSQADFDKWHAQAKAFLETGELIGFDDPEVSMNEETALNTLHKKFLLNDKIN